MRRCLSFDDVLISPVKTTITSRSTPDISTKIAGIKVKIPILSSPMDTVTDGLFANSLSQHGGIGIVHRFLSEESQLKELNIAAKAGAVYFAIGVGSSELNRYKFLYDSLGPDKIGFVNIDIANGHSTICSKMIEEIKAYSPLVRVVAGSVATGSGYRFLADSGADGVRVGIGGGSICKTRIMTGIGVPTFHSVFDCATERASSSLYDDVSIIADGGIRYPSDAVKSLIAGADAVMCGKVFAQTRESCGTKVNDFNGGCYKVYRGMASREVQMEKRGGLKAGTCAEGVQTMLEVNTTLKNVIDDFGGGIRSAMTYVNARNISELRKNSEFIEITNSGMIESHAFGTQN